ncbi:angiopoietin-related protein 5-like [Hyperolius riggenbachi]|uniref:angiopoietin-related protein 5-like n=1 Tax=Hyperolius riggenbachi TaxID=752182 RepID=UPI0035A3ADF4
MNMCGPIFLKSVILTFLCFQVKWAAVDGNVAGSDCSDIWNKNNALKSGCYVIQPEGAKTSFLVSCKMTSDGGWTVIQRHNGEDGLCFSRSWESYKQGFGSLNGEHWLGLDKIHLLTNQTSKVSQLRVELSDFDGGETFASYSYFTVYSEDDFYQLSLGNYTGTAGDAFRGIDGELSQDGSYFSTKDRDHDACSPCVSSTEVCHRCRVDDQLFTSCSKQITSSGWWFSSCGSADLNGDWHRKGDHTAWASGIHWRSWKRLDSLASSTITVYITV